MTGQRPSRRRRLLALVLTLLLGLGVEAFDQEIATTIGQRVDRARAFRQGVREGQRIARWPIPFRPLEPLQIPSGSSSDRGHPLRVIDTNSGRPVGRPETLASTAPPRRSTLAALAGMRWVLDGAVSSTRWAQVRSRVSELVPSDHEQSRLFAAHADESTPDEWGRVPAFAGAGLQEEPLPRRPAAPDSSPRNWAWVIEHEKKISLDIRANDQGVDARLRPAAAYNYADFRIDVDSVGSVFVDEASHRVAIVTADGKRLVVVHAPSRLLLLDARAP